MAGYIGSKASVVSSGVERKKTYSITGSTTSLAGLNYTVGKVHVYQNGVRLLDGTDYTATNGTSITLTVAAQSGDNVVVVSQASFQLSESYTSTEADAEFVTKTGDSMTGDLSFGDNDKAKFGAGSDLQIYHDAAGGHSRIDDVGTGNLVLRAAGALVVEKYGGDTMANFANDGAVTLYHDNAAKLATTSTGIDVTGTVTSDGLTVDGDATISSAAGSLYLEDNNYTAGQKVFGVTSKSGDLFLRSFTDDKLTATNRFGIDHSTGDISFYEDTGTTAKFFWDASAESLGIGTSSPSATLDLTVPTGDGLLINSADIATIKMKNTGGGTSSWGFATTNLAASDFGIYQSNSVGGDPITAGTARMYFNSSGNVGIGTSSPSASLHISKSDDARLVLTDTGDSCTFMVRSDGGNTSIGTDTAHPVRFMTNNSERMRIDTSGNVGIGTGSSTLSAKLVVSGPNTILHDNGGATLRFNKTLGTDTAFIANRSYNFHDGNGLAIATQDSNPIRFATNNTERMRIDSSGRVTTPYQPQVDVLLNGTRTSAGTFQTSSLYVDQGNNWNSSTHRFNAPVAARYRVTLSGYTNYTNSYGYFAIYKNGAGTGVIHFNHAWGTGHSMFGYNRVFYLAAGDYVEAKRPNSVGSGHFDALYMTVELMG